jgi:hypothetical protein
MSINQCINTFDNCTTPWKYPINNKLHDKCIPKWYLSIKKTHRGQWYSWLIFFRDYTNRRVLCICTLIFLWYGRDFPFLCNQCLSPLTLWVRIPLRRGVLDTTLCDKVWQWFVAVLWFSRSTPVSSTNKTKILLKVAITTIK